jgi:hypothetical protein
MKTLANTLGVVGRNVEANNTAENIDILFKAAEAQGIPLCAPQNDCASVYDLPISKSQRLFHWSLGRRPDAHQGLSELDL